MGGSPFSLEAMEIRIAHAFPCTPQEYWEVTRLPTIEEEIRREAEVGMDTLERVERAGRLFERTRISPVRELPVVAQKVLGTARFTYVQEVETDPATYSTTWRVVPDILPGKVTCSGRSRVVATPAGCERIIEGDIKVGIPFVGGTAEKHVVELILKSYDRAADVIRRHLPARS